MQRITELKPNQIFVFGSNLAGRHRAGAAKDAMLYFEAKFFKGEGPTGRCYAIPTKDHNLKTRPLKEIEESVSTFLNYARSYPEYEFIVTPVGCGLAGYTPEQIAPMFWGHPKNVILPDEFVPLTALATLRKKKS
jgi:hypothetical protein